MSTERQSFEEAYRRIVQFTSTEEWANGTGEERILATHEQDKAQAVAEARKNELDLAFDKFCELPYFKPKASTDMEKHIWNHMTQYHWDRSAQLSPQEPKKRARDRY